MKKILLTMAVVFSFVLALGPLSSFAQEMEEEQMTDELIEDDQLFGFGQVAEISASAMTLVEYDFETDQELQMVYVIDGDTKLDNIASLDEIKVDDEVGVNYEEKDGKKMAKTIFKYIEIEEGEIDIEEAGEDIESLEPVEE